MASQDAVSALESNAWTMFAILGAGPGGTVTDTPTRLVVQSPVPQPPYNIVLRFHDEGDRPLRQQVAEVLKPMLDRGVVVSWLVHPTSPPEVRTALAELGLVCAEEIYGMRTDVADLPPIPATPLGVEVTEATAENSTDWFHLVQWRYGLENSTSEYLRATYLSAIGSHTRLWLASIDGEPVSKVGMHLKEGVAGIYGVATTENGRNRGLASLLTLRALHAARKSGATSSVLHSTPMARGLYTRLGYEDVATFEFWAEPNKLHL